MLDAGLEGSGEQAATGAGAGKQVRGQAASWVDAGEARGRGGQGQGQARRPPLSFSRHSHPCTPSTAAAAAPTPAPPPDFTGAKGLGQETALGQARSGEALQRGSAAGGSVHYLHWREAQAAVKVRPAALEV